MAKVMTGDDDERPENEDVIVLEKPPAKESAEAEHEEEEDDDKQAGERTARNSDEEEELSPEQRREKNRRKREAKRQQRESYRKEMDYLRSRNDELEQRMLHQEQSMSAQQRSNLDSQLQQARNELAMAEQVMVKALANNNAADHVKALQFRDDARERITALTGIKSQAEQTRQQPAPQQQNRPDPVVMRNLQKFQDKHEWFAPDSNDEDSIIARAIDSAVAGEGYDPKTKDYWDELERRLAKRLPERFTGIDPDDEDDDRPAQRRARGGPAVGSGRAGASAAKVTEIHLSRERVEALKEAGLWENEKDRKRMAKRYAEHDRQMKEARNNA